MQDSFQDQARAPGIVRALPVIGPAVAFAAMIVTALFAAATVAMMM